MRNKRLLWQIYPYFLVIAFASLAGITWYDCEAIRNFYLDRTKDELHDRALLLESNTTVELTAGHFGKIDEICKEFGKLTNMRITVVLPDGKVVGDTVESPTRMDNHSKRPEISRALVGEVGWVPARYSDTLKEWRAYLALPLFEKGKIIGVLRTSLSMNEIDQALGDIRFRVTMFCAIVALLFAGISYWGSRSIVRPLENLKNGAERLAQGDFSHKLPVSNIREIGVLAETLNRMADALEEKMRDIMNQGNEREAILSSMAEGVLAVDSAERLLRINDAAAKFLEIDPATAHGRMLQEAVRNHELQTLLLRVLSTQQGIEDEITLHTERGERNLQAQGAVLRDARGTIGAVAILHEVTQLKKLEKVRRDFVANVSHELRTPVTSIKGFVETLLDGAMDDPVELRRFLEIVAAQTDRLNAIIEDLLMLSRIEQGEEKSEIPLKQASIKSVLETAIEVCRMKATGKKIGLELVCDEYLTAAMNAPLLEQAVINLIDNAINYSMSEESVRVSAERGEGEIVINVRDHGCGIGREHLSRIFERFYRVDKARSRKLGGTGLGLAIVKHIAQIHGGKATVVSLLGHGSTFSIHLPVHS
jgi:two-component system, OmpR family, phosphate regulon sensor histidine kinase PhoR